MVQRGVLPFHDHHDHHNHLDYDDIDYYDDDYNDDYDYYRSTDNDDNDYGCSDDDNGPGNHDDGGTAIYHYNDDHDDYDHGSSDHNDDDHDDVAAHDHYGDGPVTYGDGPGDCPGGGPVYHDHYVITADDLAAGDDGPTDDLLNINIHYYEYIDPSPYNDGSSDDDDDDPPPAAALVPA